MVRHGATLWNEQDLFTGWGDAPLSPEGQKQSVDLGQRLARNGFEFDLSHCSLLSRSEDTLDGILRGLGRSDIPRARFWRLNERHYGALQERPRQEMVRQYGDANVIAWRRTFDARPPELEENDDRWQEQCARLPDVPEDLMPRSESLQEGALRVEPYWQESLAPLVRDEKRVLVVAHTSSLRGLVRILEGLSDQEAEAFRIPAAIPLVYELDAQLQVVASQVFHGDLKNRWRHFKSRQKPRWISWM